MDSVKLISNISEQVKLDQRYGVNIVTNSPQNEEKIIGKSNINTNELQKAVDKANKVFNDSTHLKFEIHDKTKDIMVKIINDETGEVIKEIPPKKIIDMVAKMCEIAGIIVDEKR